MTLAQFIDQRPRHSAPDAGVIEEARGRQRRQRGFVGAAITAGIVAIVLAFVWSGGSGGAGPSGNIGRGSEQGHGLAALSGAAHGTQLISSVGVSLMVPRGWFGRSAGRFLGMPVWAAWLQTTNFPRKLVHGEDPIKAMRASDVALTIFEPGPVRWGVHGEVRPPVLRADEAIPPARTPLRHVVLESSVIFEGRLLTIDADFGSRNAAHRLLAVVNRVLGTLRVRRARHG